MTTIVLHELTITGEAQEMKVCINDLSSGGLYCKGNRFYFVSTNGLPMEFLHEIAEKYPNLMFSMGTTDVSFRHLSQYILQGNTLTHSGNESSYVVIDRIREEWSSAFIDHYKDRSL